MLDMHCLRQGTHKTHAAIKKTTPTGWIGLVMLPLPLEYS